jgi:hypothetical protein
VYRHCPLLTSSPTQQQAFVVPVEAAFVAYGTLVLDMLVGI